MDPLSTNYYNILEIPSTATLSEIKEARNRLARQAHSDKGGDDEIMKVINAAFKMLSDPLTRAEYDKLGKLKMSVKKQRMVRTRKGKLADADVDEDTTSPEAKFAKRMTKEYEKIGKYFPELIRLRELAKLQALSAIAQDVHANVKRQISQMDFSREKIESNLDRIRKQFTYPSSLNIEDRIDECLRKNRVSRSELSWAQMEKLRSDLLEQFNQQDLAYEKQIADILRKFYHADGEGSGAVRNWLYYGEDYNSRGELIDILKISAEKYQKAKLSKICETFENLGIATQSLETSNEGICSRVPVAFNQRDHYKVYGGVRNVAQLSNGGPIGGGAAGKGFQHVVSLQSSGYIHGTTTCVDRVTGNTYTKVLTHGGSIQDQWNQNSKLNINASMKSTFQITDVKYYTEHTNGSAHIHRHNGYTDCTNAAGKTTT